MNLFKISSFHFHYSSFTGIYIDHFYFHIIINLYNIFVSHIRRLIWSHRREKASHFVHHKTPLLPVELTKIASEQFIYFLILLFDCEYQVCEISGRFHGLYPSESTTSRLYCYYSYIKKETVLHKLRT